MTGTLLEQQREGVEAQMHWAIIHGGDQELLDLLRVESDRLGLMTGQVAPGRAPRPPITAERPKH
jgi:hypothetical protein